MNVGVGTRSAAREEALLEELVYAVSHIAHAEQHLLELDSQLDQPLLAVAVDRLRSVRKTVGEVLLAVAGLRSGGSDSEFRSAGESLWCALKHLSMALVHCDECAEKIVKRLVEASASSEPSALESFLVQLKEVYEARKAIRETLLELLTKGAGIPEGVVSARCREDLCADG